MGSSTSSTPNEGALLAFGKALLINFTNPQEPAPRPIDYFFTSTQKTTVVASLILSLIITTIALIGGIVCATLVGGFLAAIVGCCISFISAVIFIETICAALLIFNPRLDTLGQKIFPCLSRKHKSDESQNGQPIFVTDALKLLPWQNIYRSAFIFNRVNQK